MNSSKEYMSSADLKTMQECLDQIEGHLTTLSRIGGTMPVIEKNVRALKSFVHALKFGISDLADLEK